MAMGCKTGGMRLSPSPLALMGVYMHGIQFRHLKLRFLALMCIWVLPQLPKIAAIHRWAGDACNPRVRTGAAMSGWSRILSTLLLARRLKIFCFFLKYHMRAIAQHAFIRVIGFPTFDPDTCPSAEFAQRSPINLYIYIYIHTPCILRRASHAPAGPMALARCFEARIRLDEMRWD